MKEKKCPALARDRADHKMFALNYNRNTRSDYCKVCGTYLVRDEVIRCEICDAWLKIIRHIRTAQHYLRRACP